MTKQDVIDFLTSGFSLANLPDSFMQLRRIANDPHSDIEDVVAVARKDAELAASLLKLANSSLYNNSGEQVGTIEEAAQKIGLRKVVESSLALGIIKQVNISHANFDINSYWRRSLSVAIITEDIFEVGPRLLKSVVDRKMLYTAGLLHDIGMLALIQGFPEEMMRIMDISICEGLPVQEVELQTFGFSHQDVGRILFKKWGLPEELQCVAGFHHHPLELKRRLFYPLVDLVYVADYICSVCGSHSPTAFRPVMFEEVWKRSGLSVDLIGEFVDRVEEVAVSADTILTC
ncbi:HDOD domain family [Verrucomicrobiia bacterium DG1235]|nr:HDOD domain family [Verrucomicrobiae bacterium DG1235]